MNQLTLPPVAKSFYTHCKKCEADRYHRVLAHTSSTSAKIECEVCKSRKTYSLPKAGASSSSVVRRSSSSAGGSGSSTRATSARSHSSQYELMVQNFMNAEASPYSIKGVFKENQKIQHPKFGIGFIQKVYTDKVDVVFQDEVKSLMHNRK